MRKKVSNYIPSNDSEVIARLMDKFQYDSSKTKEVLLKYEKFVKPSGPVKVLRPKNK